jgi:hypothetical protein
MNPPLANPVPLTRRWWFTPMPLGRIAALRTIAYLFIPLDVFLFTPWVRQHADISTKLYEPMVVGRWLHLPAPTHSFVLAIQWLMVVVALIASTGRAPRILGAAIFLLYGEWMVIAMSYGKVDHDRYAYLVLLAVLPTIDAARHGDRERSEAAGWALRCVQIAVVLTYFLSSWAKIRFGGLNWATGAVFERAIVRRGTFLSNWLLHYPHLLEIGQFAMVVAELSSPLILLARSDRARYAAVALMYAFHLVTFGALTIVFLPHLVAILAFLPLERFRPVRWVRDRRAAGRAASPQPAPATPVPRRS